MSHITKPRILGSSTGIDDHIYEIVDNFEEALAGLNRSAREIQWQDLIRYVDELVRADVRLVEGQIREEEEEKGEEEEEKERRRKRRRRKRRRRRPDE